MGPSLIYYGPEKDEILPNGMKSFLNKTHLVLILLHERENLSCETNNNDDNKFDYVIVPTLLLDLNNLKRT